MRQTGPNTGVWGLNPGPGNTATFAVASGNAFSMLKYTIYSPSASDNLPPQQPIQATGICNFTNQQHDQYVCDQCPNANELEPVIKADLLGQPRWPGQ